MMVKDLQQNMKMMEEANEEKFNRMYQMITSQQIHANQQYIRRSDGNEYQGTNYNNLRKRRVQVRETDDENEVKEPVHKSEPMRLSGERGERKEQQMNRGNPLVDMINSLASATSNPFDLISEMGGAPISIGISTVQTSHNGRGTAGKQSTANIEIVEDTEVVEEDEQDNDKLDDEIQEDLDELLKSS
jgi:hypothetical protein